MNNSFAEWGFRCGRLFGVDIKIHWTFLLYVAMELLRSPDIKLQALFLVVLFVTVVIHEFGHIFGARHYGLSANRILLWPFGGLASVGSGRTTREDFWITFWGPFVHIPIGLLATAWLYWQGATFHLQLSLLDPVAMGMSSTPTSSVFPLMYVIWQVQLMLFCFNVFLPAYPMDGGRMLVSILLPRLGPDRTSLVAMVLCSVCGVYLLVGHNSFIAFLLLMEAAQLYQLRQTGQIYSHPSFAHGARPLYAQPSRGQARAQPNKPREPRHLHLVGTKQCPKCGRSLPETAKMCGFCEINV